MLAWLVVLLLNNGRINPPNVYGEAQQATEHTSSIGTPFQRAHKIGQISFGMCAQRLVGGWRPSQV